LVESCPECKSERVVRDYDTGEVVCRSCGLVIEERTFDERPELLILDDGKPRSGTHTGMPVLFSVHDKGLTTTIGLSSEDAFGKKLSEPTCSEIRRLRKWQTRLGLYKLHENLARAMAELDRMCDLLAVPRSTKEEAAVVYRMAVEANLVRGRSISSTVAASIYAACRITGVERSIKEVADASLPTRRRLIEPKGRWKSVKKRRVDDGRRKDVSRSYRLMVQRLNLKVPGVNPTRCLLRVAERAKVSGEAKELALRILRVAGERRLLIGKEPMAVAAAALHIACELCGEEKSQREMARAAQVTDVTLRSRRRELLKGIGEVKGSP
jgi:transcription initiation factor TFIIB